MAIIQSGATSDQLTIDPTSKAARVTIYDTNNNAITTADRGAIAPGVTTGTPLIGTDYKTARLLRTDPVGSLHTGMEQSLLFYDAIEGAAYDSNKWIQAATTFAISQTTGVMLFNSGSSLAANSGIYMLTHRKFPQLTRGALIYRARLKVSAHSTGNILELGFGTPTATFAGNMGDGAFWRKDANGQWIPILSIGGTEFLGTGISNTTFSTAIPVTDYFVVEIFLDGPRYKFILQHVTAGIISEQWLDLPAAQVTFQQTHLAGFLRNSQTSATSVAVQMSLAGLTILADDALLASRPWNTIMSGMNYNSMTLPVSGYTQNANYANSAAPATATLSNTTAGYANLGGQFQFAATAGVETDYALFAFQIPSPYTFFLTDINISLYNTGAAVATTATVFQWCLGVNSAGVSLVTSPYPPMRIALGQQNLQIGAAVGQAANDIFKNFNTPIAVQPTRYVHIILKMPIGTATASEIFRGTVSVGGYFE